MLAVLVFNAVAAIGNRLYPVPAGVPLPFGAYVVILTGWVAGASIGAFAASEFSGRGARWPGWGVGVLVTGAAVLNMLPQPHSIWGSIAAVAVVPAAGAAGTYLALRHPADAPPI